jgi:hypothetical protein
MDLHRDSRNDGDSEALNVNAELTFSGPTDDAQNLNFGSDEEIPAGGTHTLRAGPFDRFDLSPKNDGDLVAVALTYNDIASTVNSDLGLNNNPHRKDIFAAI